MLIADMMSTSTMPDGTCRIRPDTSSQSSDSLSTSDCLRFGRVVEENGLRFGQVVEEVVEEVAEEVVDEVVYDFVRWLKK